MEAVEAVAPALTPESLIEASIAHDAAQYKPPDPYRAIVQVKIGMNIGLRRAKWLFDAYALTNPGVFLKYRPRTAENGKLWMAIDLGLAGLCFYWCSLDVGAGRMGSAVFYGLIGVWCLWAIVVSFRYIQFLKERGIA